MPWRALPFKSPEIENLKERFKVAGLPTLVVLDAEGRVVSLHGVDEIIESGGDAILEWQGK